MNKKNYFLFTVLFLMCFSAQARVMFAPLPSKPAPLGPDEEKEFDSFFGETTDYSPKKNYTSSLFIDEDKSSHDFEDSQSIRRPAGLEFTSNIKQVSPRPVNDDKVGTTQNNQNQKPLSYRLGVQEIALVVTDGGFLPPTIFATKDIPLKIYVTGASDKIPKKTLCMMLDEFKVRKQILIDRVEEIEFTPSETGSYRIYCPINGAEGTLLVKEFPSYSLGYSMNVNKEK